MFAQFKMFLIKKLSVSLHQTILGYFLSQNSESLKINAQKVENVGKNIATNKLLITVQQSQFAI